MSKTNNTKIDKFYFVVLKSIGDDPEIEVGSLWQLEEYTSQNMAFITRYDGPNAGMLKHIEIGDEVKEIGYEKVHLLLAIPHPIGKRIAVANDPVWLDEGVDIIVNTVVRIFDFPGLTNGAVGTVRFKGRLPSNNGISFGIDLESQYSGQGTTNGQYGKKTLFSCPDDCGIFVSILQVRKYHATTYSHGGALSKSQCTGTSPVKSNLYINERVTWISDNGPEFGTVKWIGVLPQSTDKNNVIVGVEFDNEVGSGTGRYKGEQLFTAKHNHASLIPILGLLKASDYIAMVSQDSAHVKSVGILKSKDFSSGHVRFDDRKIDDKAVLCSTPADAAVSALINKAPYYTTDKGNSSNKSLIFNEIPLYEQKFFDFQVESKVFVKLGDSHSYGIIKWMGVLPQSKNPEKIIVGIRMESKNEKCCTGGVFLGTKLFECPPNRALFIPLNKCQPDLR